jgi:hypothetical protein
VHLVSSDWRIATSSCRLPASRWVFLVGVRRPGLVELWMDGRLSKSAAAGDEDMVHGVFSHAAIGAYPPSGVARSFFRGDIDEVRLFDTALTGEQIARLYLDEKPQ